MSTFVRAMIGCGQCQQPFSAKVATSLHTTREPEIREALLRGDFHQFDCPNCGFCNIIDDRTFVYTDWDRFQWITVYPPSGIRYRTDLETRATESYNAVLRMGCPGWVRDQWADKFNRWVVFGLNALCDRLLALEANLDVRVLEGVKLQLIRDLPLTPMTPGMALWFKGIEENQMVFVHEASPGPEGMSVNQKFSVDRSVYDVLETRRTALEVSCPSLFSGITVDWRTTFWPEEPLPEIFQQSQEIGIPYFSTP